MLLQELRPIKILGYDGFDEFSDDEEYNEDEKEVGSDGEESDDEGAEGDDISSGDFDEEEDKDSEGI